MIVFVSGGARSGKSAYAEGRAREIYRQAILSSPSASLVYVATARLSDDEMKARIERHRTDRGDGWVTVEESLHLLSVLAGRKPGDVVLIDCLTLWLNDALFRAGWDYEAMERELIGCVQEARRGSLSVVIVSNDVNEGVPIRDRFVTEYIRHLQKLHRALVQAADEAVQVTAGIPVYWKGGPV